MSTTRCSGCRARAQFSGRRRVRPHSGPRTSRTPWATTPIAQSSLCHRALTCSRQAAPTRSGARGRRCGRAWPYGLLVLGARRTSAASTSCSQPLASPPRRLGADVVVTGEGSVRLAEPARQGHRPASRNVRARGAPLPCIVLIAGQVLVGRRETMGIGLSGAYAVAETPEEVGGDGRPGRHAGGPGRPGGRGRGHRRRGGDPLSEPRRVSCRGTLRGPGMVFDGHVLDPRSHSEGPTHDRYPGHHHRHARRS
jgi:hypothetical protein